MNNITELKAKSKINTFYFELLTPAIPHAIFESCKQDDISLLLKNLYHIVGKRLVSERSILDNKLAYKNLSITHRKKTKKETK